MLMNLTRMREFKWEEYVTSVYHQYRLNIPWGDQDIINVIFHYHPGKFQSLIIGFLFCRNNVLIFFFFFFSLR